LISQPLAVGYFIVGVMKVCLSPPLILHLSLSLSQVTPTMALAEGDTLSFALPLFLAASASPAV